VLHHRVAKVINHRGDGEDAAKPLVQALFGQDEDLQCGFGANASGAAVHEHPRLAAPRRCARAHNAQACIVMLMEQRPTPKHFSMIRGFHLADFFTLANAACGVGAMFLAMLYLQSGAREHFYAAAAMAPLAFFFDWLDGNVARWRHQHSALGRELDSLSDVISFGVAPAVLGFAAGLNGGWDAVALIYFVCCGVSRLARFNVTAETLAAGSDSGKVAYFEGTPIPTSVVLTAVLAL